MRKRLFWLLGLVIFLSLGYSLSKGLFFSELHGYRPPRDSLAPLVPTERHIIESKVGLRLLNQLHYKRLDLSDSLSAVAFSHFISLIDGAHMYFTDKEIKEFESKYATQVDDMILRGSLQPIYDLYAMYRTRALEYVSYTQACLERGFNFYTEEYLNAAVESRPYPKNKQEMQERWRKTIKNNALSLQLSGKKEKEINEILSKRHTSLHSWLIRINSEDVFQDFMTTVAQAFDPHSTYFSAVGAENFDIEISKSLEGIGAKLSQDANYIIINELVPGGPAFKTQSIQPADRIIGVAEGDTGPFVDLIGWRVNEAVQLIRGKKGTVVRLLILPAQSPPNGPSKEVRIIRDKIALEDAVATQKTYQINRNNNFYTLGVINLPSFYIDWEAKQISKNNYRSASRDVKHIIDSLEKIPVDGIIIDLRKNGGGALFEAIELTGLFIEQGPVVQVQNQKREIFVQADQDPSIAYSGPLLVLIDRFSASASEIFAGAIQDYNRGFIAGEPTHGKGSVQNIFQLKDYLPELQKDNKTGKVKLTFAQYYRVNGASTQKKGVIPDFLFPSYFNQLDHREIKQIGALEWDSLSPIPYSSSENALSVNLSMREKIQKDLQKDLQSPQWQKFIQEREHNKSYTESLSSLSLHLTHRKEQNEALSIYESDTLSMDTLSTHPRDPLEKDHYLRQGLGLLADMVYEYKRPQKKSKP